MVYLVMYTEMAFISQDRTLAVSPRESFNDGKSSQQSWTIDTGISFLTRLSQIYTGNVNSYLVLYHTTHKVI